jgi:basic membrane protein A
MTNFTVDDYKALVAAMNDGTVKVSNSTDAMPSTEIKVTEFDNIH